MGPFICKIDKNRTGTSVKFSRDGEKWVSAAEFFDIKTIQDYTITINSKEILSFEKTIEE